MAEGSFYVDAYGARVKVRSPGVVVLLHAVTLGFYNWYWYYCINRELRDFGRVYRLERLQGTRPWLSVLATSIGLALIVPAIVSWVRCTRRIQEAQAVLDRKPLSGWPLGLSLAAGPFVPLCLLVIPYLVQEALNDVYRPFEGLDPHSGLDPAQTPISVGALSMLPVARSWDLSALNADDFHAITHFLLRRTRLAPATRRRIAGELAGRMRPSVPDADESLEAERLLELIVAARGAEELPAQVS